MNRQNSLFFSHQVGPMKRHTPPVSERGTPACGYLKRTKHSSPKPHRFAKHQPFFASMIAPNVFGTALRRQHSSMMGQYCCTIASSTLLRSTWYNTATGGSVRSPKKKKEKESRCTCAHNSYDGTQMRTLLFQHSTLPVLKSQSAVSSVVWCV